MVVSSTGEERVAAYGEDMGGSHYSYHALPEFGALLPFKAQNKKEVTAWWVVWWWHWLYCTVPLGAHYALHIFFKVLRAA